MKTNYLLLLSLIFLFCTSCKQKAQLDNCFYCFNNGVRTLPNAPIGYKAQAVLLKELGYDGLAGYSEDDYFEFRKALDEVDLYMPEIYVPVTIDSGVPVYNPLLLKAIRDSKDRKLLVTLHLHSNKYMNDKELGDSVFVSYLSELADSAALYNVKMAVYPHINFYCETIDHALKLAEMINRPNMGVVFNLCHFLKMEGAENIKEKLVESIPHLFMVSICGADSGDTKNMNWDQLIQPLGEGSFDTYSIVKILKDNSYSNLFGLQCYNIKQDCKTALTTSINTWKLFKEKYANEN